MMVSNKKSKVRLVVSTVLFILVFVVLVGGFAILFSTTTATQMTGQNTVSGSAVSGESVTPAAGSVR